MVSKYGELKVMIGTLVCTFLVIGQSTIILNE